MNQSKWNFWGWRFQFAVDCVGVAATAVAAALCLVGVTDARYVIVGTAVVLLNIEISRLGHRRRAELSREQFERLKAEIQRDLIEALEDFEAPRRRSEHVN